MKIASWNVNGVRACLREGRLEAWLRDTAPDIACLQEVKAAHDVLGMVGLDGYRAYWHPARKPGYSGTAFLMRDTLPPPHVRYGMGVEAIDDEGRVMVAELETMTLVNVYAPHSQRELGRLDFKLDFCHQMDTFLDSLRQRGKPLLVGGDLNVAHHPIDLANPKANLKNAGFLPAERAWLDGWHTHGMVDVFRHFCSDGGHYTWWSQRAGVREKNIGWRIDAFWADHALMAQVDTCFIQPHVRGSDHCPVVVELY